MNLYSKMLLLTVFAFGAIGSLSAQTLTIGSGTDFDLSQPMDRYYDYSVHEAIYTSAQMGSSKLLTSIAYYKGDGTNTDSILNVSIYMKHTVQSEFNSGNYSLNGYTLVFQGKFPNNLSTGWMNVNLQTPFVYDGTKNLQLLFIKGYQPSIDYFEAPMWRFSFLSTDSQRSSSSSDSLPVYLYSLPFQPDVRFNYSLITLAAPQLISPADAVTNMPVDTTLTWSPVAYGTSYQVEAALNNTFTTKLIDTIVSGTSLGLSGLAGNTYHYWRVKALSVLDTSDWSAVWSFKTKSGIVSRTIQLAEGWNMISSNLALESTAMSEILSQISDNMIIIKNASGQIYAPPFQTSLSNWDVSQAYMIKMRIADSLILSGTPINPITTPIALNQLGWYWLPYYRTSTMTPANALTTIQGKYLQIKSINGQVFEPQSFDSLQFLEPGKGYMLRVTATDGVLTYPAN